MSRANSQIDIQALIRQFQQAQQGANTANEQRYQQLLGELSNLQGVANQSYATAGQQLLGGQQQAQQTLFGGAPMNIGPAGGAGAAGAAGPVPTGGPAPAAAQQATMPGIQQQFQQQTQQGLGQIGGAQQTLQAGTEAGRGALDQGMQFAQQHGQAGLGSFQQALQALQTGGQQGIGTLQQAAGTMQQAGQAGRDQFGQAQQQAQQFTGMGLESLRGAMQPLQQGGQALAQGYGDAISSLQTGGQAGRDAFAGGAAERSAMQDAALASFGDAHGALEGQGDAARERIRQQTNQQLARNRQQGISRGLGNTTIGMAMDRGVFSDQGLRNLEIDEMVGAQRAGVFQNQAGLQSQIGESRGAAGERLGAFEQGLGRDVAGAQQAQGGALFNVGQALSNQMSNVGQAELGSGQFLAGLGAQRAGFEADMGRLESGAQGAVGQAQMSQAGQEAGAFQNMGGQQMALGNLLSGLSGQRAGFESGQAAQMGAAQQGLGQAGLGVAGQQAGLGMDVAGLQNLFGQQQSALTERGVGPSIDIGRMMAGAIEGRTDAQPDMSALLNLLASGAGQQQQGPINVQVPGSPGGMDPTGGGAIIRGGGAAGGAGGGSSARVVQGGGGGGGGSSAQIITGGGQQLGNLLGQPSGPLGGGQVFSGTRPAEPTNTVGDIPVNAPGDWDGPGHDPFAPQSQYDTEANRRPPFQSGAPTTAEAVAGNKAALAEMGAVIQQATGRPVQIGMAFPGSTTLQNIVNSYNRIVAARSSGL